MALTTTPGSSAANCYVSLANADTFFGNLRVAEAWDGLSDPNKEIALKNATADVDRFMREHVECRVMIDQARVWPFWWEDGEGEFALSLSPDSGTTEGFTSTSLANADWPDEYLNGGSVFVLDADDEAPEFELQAISGFTRSTGAIKTAAFTAELANGDTVYLIRPVPKWLKDATCYQALFLLTDKTTERSADRQAGITSRSSPRAGSVSLKDDAPADWLCREAYKLIEPHMPMNVEVGRG